MDYRDLAKGMRFSNPESTVSLRNPNNWKWNVPEVIITNVRRDPENPELSMIYYQDNGGNKYKTDALNFTETYGGFVMESMRIYRNAAKVDFSVGDLAELLEHEGNEDMAPELYQALKEAGSKEINDVLLAINDAGGFHGIEGIRDPTKYDAYYGETVAMYTNSGDMYSTCVLYDIEDGTVMITTKGDWYEAYESARINEIIEEFVWYHVDNPSDAIVQEVYDYLLENAENANEILTLEDFSEDEVADALKSLGYTEEEEF